MTSILKLIAVLIASFVASRILSRYNRWRWERKLGAKPIRNVEPHGLFGIRFGFRLLENKRQGISMDYHRTRYDRLPAPHVPLFSFTVFGKRQIMTRDPENIKAILSTQFSDFDMSHRRSVFYPVLGDGIFASDGETWRHSRAVLKPQFTRGQIGRLETLEPHVQLLVKHVRLHNGQAFDMQELFFRFTVDSSSSFLFGESAKSLENFEQDAVNDDSQFANAFNNVQEELTTRMVSQGLKIRALDPKYERSLQTVNDFANYFVTKALDMLEEELQESKKDGYVFLRSLCEDTRDPKVLRDQLLNIMVAGRDTTASLLSFTIYELARNNDLWKVLQQEVNDQFGTGLDGITFESLKQCLFLRAVLNELLRMYPPVPANSRTASRTTTLPRGGGHDGQSPILLEKGQLILYSVYAMHRNPDIYGADAQKYDPTRWLDGRTKGLTWEYLPFNGGPRVCLGQQFALTEASYVVVRLAQTFSNLRLANPAAEYPPRIVPHFSIKLKEGLDICMS